MKLIPLTGKWGQGEGAMVDNEDHEYLSQYTWYKTKTGYAARSKYSKINGKMIIKVYYMHRVILNAPKGMDVDHINANGIDNRRSNIRLATRSQNVANSRLAKNNTTGYKGIKFKKENGRWEAFFMYMGKRSYLGSFTTAIEAARAYNKTAKKYHGQYARLNGVAGLRR